MPEADRADFSDAELQKGVPVQREFHRADNRTELSDVGAPLGDGRLHIRIDIQLQVTRALREGLYLDTRIYTVTARRQANVRTIDRDPIRCLLGDDDVPVFLTYCRFICRECDRGELPLRRVCRDEGCDVFLHRGMMVDPATAASALL